MVRLVLDTIEQIEYFKKVNTVIGLSVDQIGTLLGMSGRNYRDWMLGKILPRKDLVNKLSNLSGVTMPTVIEEREEWWSGRVNGRIGGLARIKKYGVTLTTEDRVKGGHISQEKRAQHPDYYRALGCRVANDFVKPKLSSSLAELCGVVLGDGSISRDQCQISLHMIDDRLYSQSLIKLIRYLFGVTATVSEYPIYNSRRIIISGVKFVSIMEDLGLKRGDKVRNQVIIPDWIMNNTQYLLTCMKGLYDTDGGTFTHRHVVNGYKYINFGITFTNMSIPLLDGYCVGLEQLGIRYTRGNCCIFVYRKDDIKKFMRVIKPRNIKHVKRWKKYLSGVNSLGKIE